MGLVFGILALVAGLLIAFYFLPAAIGWFRS
jgi:hypothetical protein